MVNTECTVGILRPPEASRLKLASDTTEDSEGAHIDEQIQQIREMFEEAAGIIEMRIKIREYQMHGITTAPFGRTRARTIRKQDILVVINPSPEEYRFAIGMGDHPLQRSVIAYSNRNTLLDYMEILSAGKIPLITTLCEEGHDAVNRIFAMYTPLNSSLAADEYRKNVEIARRACLYPQISPIQSHFSFSEILYPGARISPPECRHLFVEEEKDIDGPESPFDIL